MPAVSTEGTVSHGGSEGRLCPVHTPTLFLAVLLCPDQSTTRASVFTSEKWEDEFPTYLIGWL